jgi:hypothetical protein
MTGNEAGPVGFKHRLFIAKTVGGLVSIKVEESGGTR